MERTYFPGLNALRFYAALSVIVHHFVAPVYWFDDPTASGWYLRFVFMEGGTAVTLFFVLSGFLILYLLIREKDTTGTVSISRFYIRRIFRILPLYYLTLLVGAALIFLTWDTASENAHREASNPLYWIGALFFFYNFLLSSALPISHLWSLNVEEQFYLIAPRLIKSVRSVPVVLITFIVLKVAVELLVSSLFESTGNNVYRYVLMLLQSVRFEAMALGGLGAYLVYKKHPLLNLIFNPFLQVVTLVLFIIVALGDIPVLPGMNFAIAFIFMLVIVNTVAAPYCIYRFESPLLRQLGDLSYSMYMAHAPILWFLYVAGAKGTVFQVSGVALTLGVAYVLHRYFEQPFMRLRDRIKPSQAQLTAITTMQQS